MNGAFFDNGVIRIFVPEGWGCFPGIDSDGKETPRKLHIYKGAEIATDIFTKAGITVSFFGRDIVYFSPKFFYDDVCDINPVTMGERVFSGFKCKSLGYPYTMLEWSDKGCALQIMILEENGDSRISLGDCDVEALISSIKISEPE